MHPGLQRQRGSVLALFVMALFVLLAMGGAAMDFGHVFVGRSSLQNALDASALSAAKSLNSGKSTFESSNDGTTTFNQHLNGVLADSGIAPSYEYSTTLVPFVPGAVAPDARYVRAAVNDLTIPTTLLRVVPGIGDFLNVSGTAVSGPIPLGNADSGETCDLVPIMACAGKEPDGSYDLDCSDDRCYGYDVVTGDDPDDDTSIVLKTGSANANDWEVGAGNFQLVELECGSGGACVRDELAGMGEGCFANEDPNIHTKPGDTVGPTAQGFNTRFGIYNGPVNADEAPADWITDHPMNYGEYLDAYSGLPEGSTETAQAYRRILAVQIGDCTGTTNGSGTVPRLGIGCFFMREPATHSGNTQEIAGQFVSECPAEGSVAEDPGGGTSMTVYKIVLYKDPDTDDS